ncbi:MAG: ThuA domain-containing protein [Planctomycetota bacterium]
MIAPAARLLGATTLLAPLVAAQSGDPDAPHVVFVVGEGEYQSHLTMPVLAERVADAFGWRTTVLLDEELHTGDGNHVEGLEALEAADLVVLYLRFRRWPQSDLDALQRYVDRGGPIAAFRTSTHAFRYDDEDERATYNDFGAEVLGAPWIFHYGHGASTRAFAAEAAVESPLLAGVEPEFEVRSWTYHVRPEHPPADARVLLMGEPLLPGEDDEIGPEAVNPIAWTRTHPGSGRVFMTTMGHPEDFRVASFRRLVGNGMHWALGLDPVDVTLPDFPEIEHPDDAGRPDAPWERMDYGPFLSTALSVGRDVPPVHKGIVLRLRTREGEPTDLHAVFDTDLLALRSVWEGEVALRGIVYDGPHGVFPEADGEPLLRSAAVPGVVMDGASVDPRAEPWGPIPEGIGAWRGLHLDGDDVVLEYDVADGVTTVRERLWAVELDGEPGIAREFTTSSADGVEDGPVVRLYDGALSPEELRAYAPGETVVLPANGVVRVTLAPGAPRGDLALPDATAAEAIRRARPRWGEPLVTAGVLSDPLDRDDVARVVRAESGGAGLPLLAAEGRALEIVGDGAVGRSFVVASPPEGGTPDALCATDEQLGWWPVGDVATERERNAFTDREDLLLDGVTWRRGIVGRALDFDGTAAAWAEGLDLDFARQDATVAAWISTTKDGTVFSRGPRDGEWAPDGVTLFLRGGRLALDVGWVGVVVGGPRIDDGAWHHVAVTRRAGDSDVRLFVDGERVANGRLELRGEPQDGFAPRFGWTNEDFPESSRFSGYMDGLAVLGVALEDARVADLAAATGEPVVEATVVVAASDDAGSDAKLALDGGGAWLLTGEADTAQEFEVRTRRGSRTSVVEWARAALRAPGRTGPFRIDRLTWPDDNPHDAWLRFGAFDFVPTGDASGPASAMVATWSGDVWRVDGLDEDLDALRWTRFATGLNQPFGVVCEADGSTLVLGRDQITRLVDENGDGEADLYACASNAPRNSEHFHEPASGLTVDAEGRYVFIKAARHAKGALHDQHGSVVRVGADGLSTEVLARGFRAPIGLTVLPDGSMLASDQEGHWTPANRINLIRPDAGDPAFHGNGWAARPAPVERRTVGGESVQEAWPEGAAYRPPLCWIHPSVDRSPSSQVVASHPAWGPLQGSILGLSYGTGEVYLVLREDVGDVTQGGVVKLGIQLPTGLLHGRVHPVTGDLYVCGLFGWSSDRTRSGGFYRIRPRAERWAEALNVPTRMSATTEGLELTFLAPLDALTAAEPERWTVTAWNYRRSSDYGSPTFDLEGRRDARSTLAVERVEVSEGGRTALLRMPEFQPCMQLHVAWKLRDADGAPLEHAAHLTVHELVPSD